VGQRITTFSKHGCHRGAGAVQHGGRPTSVRAAPQVAAPPGFAVPPPRKIPQDLLQTSPARAACRSGCWRRCSRGAYRGGATGFSAQHAGCWKCPHRRLHHAYATEFPGPGHQEDWLRPSRAKNQQAEGKRSFRFPAAAQQKNCRDPDGARPARPVSAEEGGDEGARVCPGARTDFSAEC
jgi:hypothetical protein